jgi:hypothetical protein
MIAASRVHEQQHECTECEPDNEYTKQYHTLSTGIFIIRSATSSFDLPTISNMDQSVRGLVWIMALTSCSDAACMVYFSLRTMIQ